MPFKHKWRLPTGVTGNVILQWRYITGNSCNHLGYHSYDWPSPDWWGPPTMADCPAKLSPTGDKGPEQFWNWYGRITHARAALCLNGGRLNLTYLNSPPPPRPTDAPD